MAKKQTTENSGENWAEVIAAKTVELLEDQVWEEAQDENPFVRPLQAKIVEIRLSNENEKKYVKFVAVNPAQPDVKNPFEYLVEAEFRARFPKQVK